MGYTNNKVYEKSVANISVVNFKIVWHEEEVIL